MFTDSISEAVRNWENLSKNMKVRYRQLIRDKTSKSLDSLWRVLVNQYEVETKKTKPVFDDKKFFRTVEAWLYSESKTIQEGNSEAWGHKKKLDMLNKLVEEENQAYGKTDLYELEEIKPQ